MQDRPPADRSQEAYRARDLGVIAARWDARAAAWDEEVQRPECHLNDDDAYARFLRTSQAEIGRRPEFCRASGVIDAGCGTGLVLAAVISAFSWGIGVDISSEMIRIATGKSIPNAKFLVRDCFQLGSLCPRAGAILSRGILLSHYGSEQGVSLLKSIHAALLPGGFVVFDFLNEAARGRYAHSPENKTYFTRRKARALVLQTGFGSVTFQGESERRIVVAIAEKARD
jgi:SAM-dependent methyltransferase